MKKLSTGLIALFIILNLTGCGSYRNGQLIPSYKPTNLTTKADKGALIKVAQDFTIYKVDDNRIVSILNSLNPFGKTIYAINVDEGKHTIWLDLYLKGKGYENKSTSMHDVYFKNNHEYLIAYAILNMRVLYWIKDITDDKVVYGREIK
jgi:hypothetical protein